MSLYQLLNGVSQIGVFFVLPMLGKHPDEYPRFRDCFIKDEEYPQYDNHIHIYTRVGGANRGQGFGEEKLLSHPNFVATFDDSFDSTYGTYVFSVPDEWKEDFEKVINADLKNVSIEYQAQVRKVYPKLNSAFDKIWPEEDDE
jgi:hypothetical protein